jgi:hypothetical protein
MAALISALILLASRVLFSAYSNWGYEIYSVVGSQHSWRTLIPVWIMQADVQLSFYHILFKEWMNLLGAGEIATCSLSFLCGVGAMFPFARFTARPDPIPCREPRQASPSMVVPVPVSCVQALQAQGLLPCEQN